MSKVRVRIRGSCLCGCAGLKGGFENPKELHVMKYKKAMKSPDSKNWEVAVDDKHNYMTGSKQCGVDIGEDHLTCKTVCKVFNYPSNTTIAAQKVDITKMGKGNTPW